MDRYRMYHNVIHIDQLMDAKKREEEEEHVVRSM